LKIARGGARLPFPPHVRAEVIALACALPAEHGMPPSRRSSDELAREAITRGIVEQISGVTVWRWLSEDAIRPWQHRSWIFPRDPRFAERAGPIPDPYAGVWQGERLHPGDHVVCADEKPSIQARRRIVATLPAGRRRGQKVEHEYRRQGALCYLAAWDARRAKIFDRCAPKDEIEPFDQLVEQFMSQHPYSRAQRVFLIIDNGSAHRGQRSIDRLQGAWPNLIVVHTPIHASWPNQSEIYFSIVQRKVVQPQRLRRPRRPRNAPTRLRPPLRTDRSALPVEVHPQRPPQAPRQDRHHPARGSRRLTTSDTCEGVA
jgi:DDE superfamily endonuclease